ncbi:hypothetical protein Slin14017_G053730 [Septoria linicola]|nr:hypothetical protein Slin14017_G053730 [Septoria linicola]
MSLLTIPVELRLRIYDYLPDLQVNNVLQALTPYSKLTPPVCRVNNVLRHETLSVFAANSNFMAFMDDEALLWSKRLSCWMTGLGSEALSRVRTLQLGRHWKIPTPMRFQGNVGFYVKVERPKRISMRSAAKAISISSSMESFPAAWSDRFVSGVQDDGDWVVTAGTYPYSKDLRGMRLESVELLAIHIRTYLIASRGQAADDGEIGLKRDDVEFIIQAMDIIASHPISTYQLTTTGSSTEQQQQTWSAMSRKLSALSRETLIP